MQRLAATLPHDVPRTETAGLVRSLAEQLFESVARIAPPGPYALLDFPDHLNVGDSAIWLGELELLRRIHGRDPAFVASYRRRNLDALDSVLPEGAIYLHGGGNFGDLWPRHHRLRIEAMQRYGSRVIQLPQSLYFESPRSLENARRLPATGSRLFVRDRESQALAQDIGFDALLVPDAAFCMGILERIGDAVQPLLVLRRTDHESTASACQGVDWLTEPFGTRARARARSVLAGAGTSRNAYFRTLAQMRVIRGCALLSRGRRVATDRLHAHILSLMMGIPHYVADNISGKVHGLVDAWTGTSPLVAKVSSLEEAIALDQESR